MSPFPQLLLNSAIAASVWTIVGVGFGLILAVTGFFHFAHAAAFVCGAYFCYLFHAKMAFPLPVACVLAVIAAGAMGGLMEMLVYQPLRKRGSPPLVSVLASLGLYVLVQNTISLVSGDATKSLGAMSLRHGIDFFGVNITIIQVATICAGIVTVMSIYALLRYTRFGLLYRALSMNSCLAELSGIFHARIVFGVFVLSSALAGLAGILVGIDLDINPAMGMGPLMMAVVAAIIGGVRNPVFIGGGAFFLASVQQLASWYLHSQWQEPVAFLVLAAYLVLRPSAIAYTEAF